MKISTPLYHSNRRDIAEMMKEKALLEDSITKALQMVFSVTPENDEAIDIFSFWNDVFESDEVFIVFYKSYSSSIQNLRASNF